MPNPTAPPAAKSGLEKACQKAAEKVSKAVPGDKFDKKTLELLEKEVCKNIDQKIVTAAAKAIADVAKKQSSKADPNTPDPSKFKLNAKPKKPSSGAYSVTVPITSVDMAKVFGPKAKGKLSVDLWTDGKDFEKGGNTGGMLYFKINF
ncbi:MAG: hypothetical protein AAGK04_01490 [Planctomycetota bacterium]